MNVYAFDHLKKKSELCALTGSHALVYILDEECGFGNGLLERSVFSTNPHRFLRIIDEHKIPRQEGFVQNNTQVSYSASLRDAPIRSPIGSLTENGQVYVPAMTSTTTTTIQQKKDKT